MNRKSQISNLKSQIVGRGFFSIGNYKLENINWKFPPGFTLIELIVVIGIFSILAAGVLLTIRPAEQFQKAADARRKSDLNQIQKALEAYYQDNGAYPDNPATTDYRITYKTGTEVDWGTAWQPYMNVLPKDPSTGRTYVYYSPASSNGQTYYLYASLERGSKDPQVCNSGNECVSVPSPNLCVKTCNYGLASPNVRP